MSHERRRDGESQAAEDDGGGIVKTHIYMCEKYKTLLYVSGARVTFPEGDPRCHRCADVKCHRVLPPPRPLLPAPSPLHPHPTGVTPTLDRLNDRVLDCHNFF